MRLKFNLQFFGGSKTSTQRIAKRDPEPKELTDLQTKLYSKIAPGLEAFNTDNWETAQNLTNQSLGLQSYFLGQLPGQLAQNNSIASQILNVAQNGTLPSNLLNAMNASVTQGLQSSMGDMLNNLASRGVLNSSVTTAGTNQLSQAAADAFNKNYLTAYQSVLGGLGSALQGSQSNTSAMLSALGAAGSVPSQAYESIGAGLTTPYTFWKDWQNFYQNDDPYDTIVTQKTSSCITGDTLVTLEDGREIPVSELKDDDRIQVWDFESGKLSSAPLTGFFKAYSPDGFDVIRVELEDGSSIGVILEHLFFDLTLGKFVAVNADSQDYVGHEFAKVIDGEAVPVKVTAIHPDGKVSESYGPQAEGSWNYIAGGVITGNDGQLAMCNMFKFDGLHWDAKKKAEDLGRFGLLSYDVFKGIISKRVFDSNKFGECAVAFGKGLARCEEFRRYIAPLAGYFFDKEEK